MIRKGAFSTKYDPDRLRELIGKKGYSLDDSEQKTKIKKIIE